MNFHSSLNMKNERLKFVVNKICQKSWKEERPLPIYYINSLIPIHFLNVQILMNASLQQTPAVLESAKIHMGRGSVNHVQRGTLTMERPASSTIIFLAIEVGKLCLLHWVCISSYSYIDIQCLIGFYLKWKRNGSTLALKRN